jgi:hypothetical protein
MSDSQGDDRLAAGQRITPTLGERRVRLDFNPAGGDVHFLKRLSAELIDRCEAMKAGASGEKTRCAALAQTAFEEAAMWAVKAATAE